MNTVYYSSSHEWVRLEEDIATVGITRHAAEELGELVFVEAKDEGFDVAQGDAAAVVESVKAASDIYAPLGGTIVAFNSRLVDEPALVSSDPQGEGWIFKLRVSDSSQLETLLSEQAYQELL